MIEQRLFAKDRELTYTTAFAYESIWKIVLCLITAPLFIMIPVDTAICGAGYLEDYVSWYSEVKDHKMLQVILAINAVIFALGQGTSLWIIKNQNAMQKTVVGLTKTLLMWVFFLLFQGHGHEEWSWLKALGMFFLGFGTLYYI